MCTHLSHCLNSEHLHCCQAVRLGTGHPEIRCRLQFCKGTLQVCSADGLGRIEVLVRGTATNLHSTHSIHSTAATCRSGLRMRSGSTGRCLVLCAPSQHHAGSSLFTLCYFGRIHTCVCTAVIFPYGESTAGSLGNRHAAARAVQSAPCTFMLYRNRSSHIPKGE